MVAVDQPLRGLTTYKFGGSAAWLAEPENEDQLVAVINAARAVSAPVFVLGRGSNVVISDRGYNGVVIRLAGWFTEVTITDGIAVAGAVRVGPVVEDFDRDARFHSSRRTDGEAR